MIRSVITSFNQNKYLLKSMVKRDIKQRYTGSLLGLFWFIFQPLSTVLIYTFVFSFILKAKLGPEYGGITFSIWLLSGLIPWMFVNEVLNRSVNVILDNAALIKKTIIDTKWLVFSYLVTGMFNFLIFLILLLALLLYFKVFIGLKILLIVYYFVILSMFTLGISWIIASINVYLRDVGQFLGVLLNIWFYLTPIIYPISIIPEKYRIFIEINPLFHLIDGFRTTLLTNQIASFPSILYCTIFSLVLFLYGHKLFVRLKAGFVDVL